VHETRVPRITGSPTHCMPVEGTRCLLWPSVQYCGSRRRTFRHTHRTTERPIKAPRVAWIMSHNSQLNTRCTGNPGDENRYRGILYRWAGASIMVVAGSVTKLSGIADCEAGQHQPWPPNFLSASGAPYERCHPSYCLPISVILNWRQILSQRRRFERCEFLGD